MRKNTLFAVLTLAVGPAGAAYATDYYAAPIGMVESCTPDGSQACPWIGAQTALTNILKAGGGTGGDTLFLLDGNYSGLSLYNYSFANPVVVQSLNGKNAHLEYIWLKGLNQNLTFRNLSVWPMNPPSYHTSYPYTALLNSLGNDTNIVFDGLDVRSGQDGGNYMSWSQSEWLSRAISGATVLGANSSIENSTFTGVDFGAVINGTNSTMSNNVVNGFAGDAYRVLGSGSLVSGNTAENCFQIDANHNDGLQSFSNVGNNVGIIVSNVTVDDNKFIEWNSSQSNPLRCRLQGIFFGDGPYQNVVIENNLVSVTDYHGISVYSGQNVKIVNNTVVNNQGLVVGYPWIGIFNAGGQSPVTQGVVVANNLEMTIADKVGGVGVTYSDNSNILSPTIDFEDIAAYDYYPTTASGFIDTADPTYAPATDITGAPRPYGAGPDRGAYEVGAVAPTSTTTTTTSGTASGSTTTTTMSTSSGTTTTSSGTKIGHGSWKAKFLTPPGQSK